MSYNWLDSVEQTESYKPIKPRKLNFWTIKFWLVFYIVYALGFWICSKLWIKWIFPLAILATSMLFVVKKWKILDFSPSFAIDRVIIAILFFAFWVWNIFLNENKSKPVLTTKLEKSYKVVSWSSSFPIKFKTKNAEYVLINWQKYDLDWDTTIQIPISWNQTQVQYILWNEKFRSWTWIIILTK